MNYAPSAPNAVGLPPGPRGTASWAAAARAASPARHVPYRRCIRLHTPVPRPPRGQVPPAEGPSPAGTPAAGVTSAGMGHASACTGGRRRTRCSRHFWPPQRTWPLPPPPPLPPACPATLCPCTRAAVHTGPRSQASPQGPAASRGLPRSAHVHRPCGCTVTPSPPPPEGVRAPELRCRQRHAPLAVARAAAHSAPALQHRAQAPVLPGQPSSRVHCRGRVACSALTPEPWRGGRVPSSPTAWTRPQASEVTQTQKSAKKNENGIFGINASRGFRKIIICHVFGEKKF